MKTLISRKDKEERVSMLVEKIELSIINFANTPDEIMDVKFALINFLGYLIAIDRLNLKSREVEEEYIKYLRDIIDISYRDLQEHEKNINNNVVEFPIDNNENK